MFNRKFDEEGNNLADNPYIYNVEEDDRLSPGLQSLTTRSVSKILFFFQSSATILFSKTGGAVMAVIHYVPNHFASYSIYSLFGSIVTMIVW